MTRPRGVLDDVNLAEQIPGVVLDPAEFDVLIVENGSSGEVRKAVICPCVRHDSRTADVACPSCHGTGRSYPEHLRQAVIMLDTSRSATNKLAAAGWIADGNIQFTFPSGIVPSIGDMILPDGEEHTIQEVLWRGGVLAPTPSAVRAYRTSSDQVPPPKGPRHERLSYPAPCCIEAVAYRATDGEIVYPSENAYSVDPDGHWRWKDGFGPADGGAWTVRYRAPAAYVVHTVLPALRQQSDRQMPYRAQARRLDKLSSEDLR